MDISFSLTVHCSPLVGWRQRAVVHHIYLIHRYGRTVRSDTSGTPTHQGRILTLDI
jgi:hypothetical protein